MGIYAKSGRQPTFGFICSIIVFTAFAFHTGAAFAESIVLAGSGSNLPAIRLLIKAFSRHHPEIHFAEPTNIGSDGAVRAVADGAISIGLISRPLKGDEKKTGLAVDSYARTAVVIATHPLVKNNGITFSELNSIYRGEKTTWEDGRKIIVLSREPGESTINVLEEGVPGFKEVYADSIKNNRWAIILKDEGMNNRISTLPDSIGFSDIGAITSQKINIKALKLNGVQATAKNVQNGSYPLYKTLSFIYRPERLTPGMKSYMSFVCSAEGKKILLENGYIPNCSNTR